MKAVPFKHKVIDKLKFYVNWKKGIEIRIKQKRQMFWSLNDK